MSKRFVTIFPICENVHLTKDIGQIPYFLHKLYGYKSKIVCYKNSDSYPNINSEVKGLELEFIKNSGRFSFIEKEVWKYIRKNAKKIDVLNLYIFSKHAFVYGILYKLFNPKGFLYLKLDGYNGSFAEDTSIIHSARKFKNIILKLLEKTFIKKVDLISIENSEGERLVKLKFPSISSKIMYLPVGVNSVFIDTVTKHEKKNISEKENIILTVGRIGEEIKNNEMMLRAIINTDMKGWKMVFVGPVNPEFKSYCDSLFQKNPDLANKMHFTGEITKREELYSWYNKSKVFCMTSRVESFCHAIAEALYFGNYIIGTEGIMSMKDLTDNQKYGVILKHNDDKSLSEVFQNIINDDSFLNDLYPKIIRHSADFFTWPEIIKKIHKQIESN